MIVLKHLAQKFNADPADVRRILRTELGLVPGRRWKWEDETDPNYQKCLQLLSGRFTSASRANSTTTPASKAQKTSTPSHRASSSELSVQTDANSGASPRRKTSTPSKK